LNDLEPYIIRDFSDFWQLFASANILRVNCAEIGWI